MCYNKKLVNEIYGGGQEVSTVLPADGFLFISNEKIRDVKDG